MAFYSEQVLPRIQAKLMDRKPLRRPRERTCAGLHGDVVEVGFGTGLNAAYYPAEVQKVFAVEPSTLCLRIAEPLIAASQTTIEPAALSGEDLDLPSESCDAAISTWTLCTIPDVDRALSELRRVLRPRGTLHFVEHGLAPDAKVVRWQHRIEPLQKRLFGGCHLTRDIAALITNAGFTIDALDTYYLEGSPKLVGYTFEGRASKT